ncbi:hypothetical protein NDU88_002792 [Pleurodeles waltl]|uniref:Uncharacterized protein n=1 Tax=Pleurodeles waltl TaxID=8319 RepID=A0AAV7UA97_PLEWA|nr:hypothetical protein NDU88_002792 [Pleurodeles waltl]
MEAEKKTGDLACALTAGRRGIGRCPVGHPCPVCVGRGHINSLRVIRAEGEEAQTLGLRLVRLAVADFWAGNRQ